MANMASAKVGGCAHLNRREFLLAGAGAVGATLVYLSLPGVTQAVPATRASYPAKSIASLSALQRDEPVYFRYPFDDALHSASFLVKLGSPAAGGVGSDRDIVAFNALCTHMGGPLTGTYWKKYKAVGPCPLHLTTFDLTRRGMVISGNATQSLPQVELELRGDDVVAVALTGLVYGRADNLIR